MVSLRQRLAEIHELEQPGSSVSIAGDFHSVPSGSLRKIMDAMRSPHVESWFEVDETDFSNEPWTEECQGLTWIGQSWYVASNNEDRRAVYRFAFGSWDEQASADLPPQTGADHVGGLTAHDGIIYVPVDGPGGPKVWVLDANLNTQGIGDLSDKPGVKDQGDIQGWCAVNPWNGLYYTSAGQHVTQIHAYDPNDAFAYRGFLSLRGPEVNGLQGGYFSRKGRLYINSDIKSAHNANLPGTKDIRAYSPLNGAFFGSYMIGYDESFLSGEEMEGFTFLKRVNPDGELTYVHVVTLDNDATNEDDVTIKHYSTPNPELL